MHCIRYFKPPDEAMLIFDHLEIAFRLQMNINESKEKEFSSSLIKLIVKAIKTIRFSLRTNYITFRFNLT